MEQNESKLIARASSGDASAFNLLMAQHEHRMYAIALRMCKNREDAQDCLQEAMLRVFRAIGAFKGESSFGTWMYRITMNTCLDELRRKKKSRDTSMDALLDQGWSPPDMTGSPERKAMQHELRRSLHSAINDLPEDMRAAIILRDIHGCTYDEIAQVLEINVGTVKSRISRGREKLREKIRDSEELFNTDNV